MWESWVGKIPWKREGLPTPVFLGFTCGSAGKESVCSVGDLGLIPGLGRSPGGGKGYPLQYSGLENSMDCISSMLTHARILLIIFHRLNYFVIITDINGPFIVYQDLSSTLYMLILFMFMITLWGIFSYHFYTCLKLHNLWVTGLEPLNPA